MSFLELSHLPWLALMSSVMGNFCLAVVSLETFLSQEPLGKIVHFSAFSKKNLIVFHHVAPAGQCRSPLSLSWGRTKGSLNISRGSRRRVWPQKWGLMGAHSGFVQGAASLWEDALLPSFALPLGVLRMAKEGINGKQTLFWSSQSQLQKLLGERHMHADIHQSGHLETDDTIQTSNFPSSNTARRCLFSFAVLLHQTC